MKILIIRTGGLGDVILTLPFLECLKEKYKDAFIEITGEKEKLKIFKGKVNKISSIETYQIYKIYKNIRNFEFLEYFKSFDLIITFLNDEFLKNLLKINKNTYFIDSIPKIRIHASEYMINQGVKYKIIEKLNKTKYQLNLFSPKENLIIIHPGSGDEGKNWGFKNFLILAEKLKNLGYEIIFLFGYAESKLYKEISQSIKFKTYFNLKMEDLINLISKAKLYIGNDSGVTHLSSILSIKTIAIFGPTDSIVWKPLGKYTYIIRKNLSCSPCVLREKINCKNRECLYKISVEEVFKKAVNILSNQLP